MTGRRAAINTARARRRETFQAVLATKLPGVLLAEEDLHSVSSMFITDKLCLSPVYKSIFPAIEESDAITSASDTFDVGDLNPPMAADSVAAEGRVSGSDSNSNNAPGLYESDTALFQSIYGDFSCSSYDNDWQASKNSSNVKVSGCSQRRALDSQHQCSSMFHKQYSAAEVPQFPREESQTSAEILAVPAVGEGNKSYAAAKEADIGIVGPAGRWENGNMVSDCAQTDTRVDNEEHCRDNLELARTEDNHSEDVASEVTTEPGIYCCLVNLPVLVRMRTSKHRKRARIRTKPVLGSQVQQQAKIELTVMPVTNKKVGSDPMLNLYPTQLPEYRVFDTDDPRPGPFGPSLHQ